MKRLAYLNESVLLEERGLPRMHLIIIITITIIIGLFIYWANILTIDETVSISGTVANAEGKFVFKGLASASDVVLVNEGDKVGVSINGVTGKSSLKGRIDFIDTEPKKTSSGSVYYEVFCEVDDVVQYNLIEGMTVKLSITVDEQTLAQYLLGSLYEASR